MSEANKNLGVYMRALIIENEVKTAAYIRKGLSEDGFIVDVSHDGEDGLFLATQKKYDVIILDVMMPKLDGWQVIKGIRQKNPSVPVLFLSAMDQVQDRVKGLELGADDYLVKPFAFSELLARVRTLTRRRSAKLVEKTCIADLEVNFRKQEVLRQDKLIRLTSKEFALLSLLIRHQDEVLSRTYIAEQVWDINFESNTNVIDVAIRRLRSKLDEGYPIKLIHTVRGVGYALSENSKFST